jgi:hypothetical protein
VFEGFIGHNRRKRVELFQLFYPREARAGDGNGAGFPCSEELAQFSDAQVVSGVVHGLPQHECVGYFRKCFCVLCSHDRSYLVTIAIAIGRPMTTRLGAP